MPTVIPPVCIPRRAFLTGGLCAIAAPNLALAEPFPRRLAFSVLRNGKTIGEQSMTFETGEALIVRSVAEMKVKLGPVSLYHYRHEATEHWRGDMFQSLDTRTNDNGRMLQVSARREGDAIRIAQASGAQAAAAAQALPFTHWNRRIAAAPLFNPQDGKLLKERAMPAGPGLITLADGSSRRAESVVFRGDAAIEDWYDQDGVWTALKGRLKDGSELEYRRL
jgi:hypothetical protein